MTTRHHKFLCHLLLALALGFSTTAGAQTIIDSSGIYDGTQSSVLTGVNVNTQADFSLTFWFNDSAGGDEVWLGFNDTSLQFALRLDEGNSGIYFPEVNANPTDLRIQNTAQSTQFADGTDHQIVYTWDWDAGSSTGVGTLWADGSPLGSSNATAFPDPTEEIILFERPGDTFKEPFSGTLSDIAVYDSLLTSSEITTLNEGGFGTIVIPEPDSGTLIGLGAGLLLLLRRRKR